MKTNAKPFAFLGKNSRLSDCSVGSMVVEMRIDVDILPGEHGVLGLSHGCYIRHSGKHNAVSR